MKRPPIALADLTEKEWQQQVVQLTQQLGWGKAYHVFDSRRSHSGFPDLVLVRDRVVFVELKRELTGRKSEDASRQPSRAQIEWLDKLASAGGEVYLWRPADLDEIASILGHRWRFMTTPAEGQMLAQQGNGQFNAWQPNSLWIPGVGRADTHHDEQQPLLTKGAA